MACGALPLAAGTSVFLLWLVLRWGWLMTAGAHIVCGGSVLFVVGAVVLAGFWVRARRAPEFPRPRLLRLTVAAALLLAANFPAAAGIIVAAMAVQTCYVAVIENRSPAVLNAVRITGGGCEVVFGHISPDTTRRRWFWIQRDGELTLHAVRDGVPVEETVDGYVTGGMGTRTVVTFGPDGTISVTNANERFRAAWYLAE